MVEKRQKTDNSLMIISIVAIVAIVVLITNSEGNVGNKGLIKVQKEVGILNIQSDRDHCTECSTLMDLSDWCDFDLTQACLSECYQIEDYNECISVEGCGWFGILDGGNCDIIEADNWYLNCSQNLDERDFESCVEFATYWFELYGSPFVFGAQWDDAARESDSCFCCSGLDIMSEEGYDQYCA